MIISHLRKVGVSLISLLLAGLLLQHRAESCPVSSITTNEDNQEWKSQERIKSGGRGGSRKPVSGYRELGDHQ
jgi:hypothetical protein